MLGPKLPGRYSDNKGRDINRNRFMTLMPPKTMRMALAAVLALCWLVLPVTALADQFSLDRYSDQNVLVSGTYSNVPDITSIDWSSASNANIISHGGWGTVQGAQWISELPGDRGPGGSYRVYHLEITLPQNADNLTGRLDYMVDDYMWFYVNQDLAAQNTTYGNWNRLSTIDFTSALAPGLTSVVLDIVVKNTGRSGYNPTGASFHASIGGEIAAAAPEPATLLLLASALGGAGLARRRLLKKR